MGDAGNTNPADSASCTALYSDTGSCSDTSLSTEADCIAPGTCDDAGNTNPADSASCTALYSDTGSCSDTSLSTEADSLLQALATTLATPILQTRPAALRSTLTLVLLRHL